MCGEKLGQWAAAAADPSEDALKHVLARREHERQRIRLHLESQGYWGHTHSAGEESAGEPAAGE